MHSLEGSSLQSSILELMYHYQYIVVYAVIAVMMHDVIEIM